MVKGSLMTDVARILNEIEQGDSKAAEQTLPLVSDELRKFAAMRLANQKPGKMQYTNCERLQDDDVL
jgi:hypothetical protein